MNKFDFSRNVKKTAAFFLFSWLLFFLASPIAAAAALAADEEGGTNPAGLWQKALAVFQKNNDLIPHKMEVFSEMLDRQGRPDSVAKYYFNIIVDGQGNTRTELTQAIKDNRDITVETKKKMADRDDPKEKPAGKKKALTMSMGDTPFNPDKQQKVTVRAQAEKQLLFGRLCRRFDFSFKADMGGKDKEENPTWVGKAWLEENSGIPLKLEFSFEPLPKHVNNLWTIYLYEVNAAGDWVLKEITVQGQGGFLFIKKGFRSTTRFNDYRRQPQKESD
jgi:hypothetical protein